jgi:hypothetical protein
MGASAGTGGRTAPCHEIAALVGFTNLRDFYLATANDLTS